MKKPVKKLALATQTIRALDDERKLEKVGGGGYTYACVAPTSAGQQSCGGYCHTVQ